MPKKYFKIARSGVAVIKGSQADIDAASAALQARGEEPVEITAAEARRLENQRRIDAMREAIARDRPRRKNALTA